MQLGNHNPQFSYTIDGQLLDKITEHKDLGVVFDKVLKFHSHVSTIAFQANRILGMIKKCFTALQQSPLLLLYKHLVRPHFQYFINTVGYLKHGEIRKGLKKGSKNVTQHKKFEL